MYKLVREPRRVQLALWLPREADRLYGLFGCNFRPVPQHEPL